MNECAVLGCDRPPRALGLCEAHYRRMKKGKPLDTPVRKVFRGTVEARLAEYTDRRGPDECWEWTCGRDDDGYGEISVGGSSKHRRAHVVAWELANDRLVPAGYCVMHVCDNPPCVNPGHLLLGTNLDNLADRDRKGRQQRGEQHARARLTEADVRNIRRAWKRGESLTALGVEYGTTPQNIYSIVHRKSWTHI